MEHPDEPWVFDLCGGHVALDFANTVSGRAHGEPRERLTDYSQLVAFVVQSGALDAGEAARHLRWAARHRGEAEAVVERARELREACYRIFTTLAEGTAPTAADLEQLNAWIGRMRIGPDLDWEWADGARAPDAFMLPIVRASLDLLRSADRDRVAACAADTCRWLFYDASKNRSRRWCDMKSCGNREKARRFSARQSGDDA